MFGRPIPLGETSEHRYEAYREQVAGFEGVLMTQKVQFNQEFIRARKMDGGELAMAAYGPAPESKILLGDPRPAIQDVCLVLHLRHVCYALLGEAMLSDPMLG